MHAKDPFERPLHWWVEGEPEGIRIDPYTGTLAGVPENAGSFTLSVTVSVPDCSEPLSTKEFQLTVHPECEQDCDVPPSCASVRRDPVAAVIDGVGPDSSLARNGLVVHRAALPEPPGLPTSHSMVLSDPDSPSKDHLVIRYRLPGGVIPPIEGETVDVRYITGNYGDQYLFVTSEKHPRLVIYNGYLTADELVHRCPMSELGTHCPLMDFQITPTACAGSDHCDSTDILAMSVATVPFGATSTSLVKVPLMPGQSGILPDMTLLRIADATTRTATEDCHGEPFIPYDLSFYIVPVAFCSYVEIARVGEHVATAPTGSVLTGRVLYPPLFSDVDFQWSRHMPSQWAQAPLNMDANGNYWSEQPLSGEYRFFLTAEVSLDGGQVMKPCNGLPAEYAMNVPAPDGLRVELAWSPQGGGAHAPEEGPTLWVNEKIPGVPQTQYVQAVNIHPLEHPASIRVKLPEQSQRAVHLEVRIWHGGGLVTTIENTIEPNEEWIVGTLDLSGIWHPGNP